MKILFMCVANSARSQMAEGLAKKLFGADAQIESAGSSPKSVNPFAIKVMSEIGVDLAGHSSKLCEKLDPAFLVDLDFVITLCAEEVCPVIPSSKARKLHWAFSDPAGHLGTDDQQLSRFRDVRDKIHDRLKMFKSDLM